MASMVSSSSVPHYTSPTRAGGKQKNDLLSLVHPGGLSTISFYDVSELLLGVDRRFAVSKVQTKLHSIAREVSNWVTLVIAPG